MTALQKPLNYWQTVIILIYFFSLKVIFHSSDAIPNNLRAGSLSKEKTQSDIEDDDSLTDTQTESSSSESDDEQQNASSSSSSVAINVDTTNDDNDDGLSRSPSVQYSAVLPKSKRDEERQQLHDRISRLS